jgi:methionine-R-sulfoxide reductase
MKYNILFLTILGCLLAGCDPAQNIQVNQANTSTPIMNKDSFPVQLSDKEWQEKLTPDQYYVLRQSGTERPFTGKYTLHFEKGTYVCAGCGTELFADSMKFESHCGWPSFDNEIAGGKIIKREDNSHGMRRIEIICATCGGHLGHLFDDGPTASGLRYCVNSAAIEFKH